MFLSLSPVRMKEAKKFGSQLEGIMKRSMNNRQHWLLLLVGLMILVILPGHSSSRSKSSDLVNPAKHSVLGREPGLNRIADWGLRSFSSPLFTTGVAEAAQSCTPPPSGMVGWWPGDGNADDIQGSNSGTLKSGEPLAAVKSEQAISCDVLHDRI